MASVSCPRSGCAGEPLLKAAACPDCDQLLVWCDACGTANRIMARFCRHCDTRVTPAGEWRFPQGDALGSGNLPVPVAYEPQVTQRHRAELGGTVRVQPVFGHGHLFFPVVGKGVVVWREHDMQPVGALRPTGNIYALALSDEYLLMAGDKGLEVAPVLPLTEGRLPAVRVLLGLPVAIGRGATIVVDNDSQRAFVASAGMIHGVPLADGAAEWTAARAGRGNTALALVGDLLIVLEETGHMLALNPADGTTRWQINLGEEVSTRAFCATQERRVYTVTRRGVLKVIMINPDRGAPLDTVHIFRDVQGIAASDRDLFVVGAGGIHRCSPSDPRVQTVASQIVTTTPLVTRGTVFAGTNSGTLLYLDTTADSERHQVKTGSGDLIAVTPLLCGDRLYTVAEGGQLIVYSVLKGGGAA